MAANQRNNYAIYTHQLDYAVRRNFCDLLDADQSWRTLGGNFMGLDSTQLTLVYQAYLRGGSPTEELLLRLDSANVRLTHICNHLRQMNNWRALDMLEQCIAPGDPQVEGIVSTLASSTTNNRNNNNYNNNIRADGNNIINNNQINQDPANGRYSEMLSTPQHSFVEPSSALMDSIDPLLSQWLQSSVNHQAQQQQPQQPTHRCHNQNNNQINNVQNNSPLRQPNPPSSRPSTIPTAPVGQQTQDERQEAIVRQACVSNRKRTTISNQETVNQLRLIMQVKYSELKAASDNFSDQLLIGNGGFAKVYRTNWKGTEVAIKRLKCNLMDQALNELTVLNSYRIDNILPIYGISIDGPEACLVYQFMANGSLEDRIGCKGGTPPLSWPQRAVISEGLAKGIHYLHTLRDEPLIHGDVKSANILLDAQFQAKLGDFGLARQVFNQHQPGADSVTSITVTSINGTSVYLPDEYLHDKRLSTAVDVYSYGVVLLEMATGQRPVVDRGLLVKWVEERTSGTALGRIRVARDPKPLPAELRDRRLQNGSESDMRIWRDLLLKSGLRCTHRRPKRPVIGEMLDNCAELKKTLGLEVDFTESPKRTPKIVTPFEDVQAQGQGQLQPPKQISPQPGSPRMPNTARTLTPEQSSGSRNLVTPTNESPPQQQPSPSINNQQQQHQHQLQPAHVHQQAQLQYQPVEIQQDLVPLGQQLNFVNQQPQPQSEHHHYNNQHQQQPNDVRWANNQQEVVGYVVQNEPEQPRYVEQPQNGYQSHHHHQQQQQQVFQTEFPQQADQGYHQQLQCSPDLYEHQQQHHQQQQPQTQYVIMHQGLDQDQQVFEYEQPQGQIYQVDQQYIEQPQYHQLQRGPYDHQPNDGQPIINNSAMNLMSVEEIQQQPAPEAQIEQESQAGQEEVESMLPLLSELGINQPSNQQ